MEATNGMQELKDGQTIPLGDRPLETVEVVEARYREAIGQLRNFMKGVCGRELRRSEKLRYNKELDRLADECDVEYAALLDAGLSRERLLEVWKEGRDVR